MREIKFRAWDKRTCKMWNDLSLFFMATTNGHNDADAVFMQYTGLKDKNGKEIYDGDIINFWDWGRDKILLGVSEVYWSEEDKGWSVRPDFTDGDRYDLFRSFEVIGNIYENPDLLKG